MIVVNGLTDSVRDGKLSFICYLAQHMNNSSAILQCKKKETYATEQPNRNTYKENTPAN